MINLIHGDCMEYMATLKDNEFDLAVVDPPYGIGEDGKTNHSRETKGIKPTMFTPKDWDKSPPPPEYFDELMRVSKRQIIWGGNYFDLPPSSCWLVWDKINYGSHFADCELAWTNLKTAVRQFRFMWNGMLQGDMKHKQKRIHPTQKPIQLYQWIFDKYAKKGWRILDTHLGSGSSAIAAHDSGLDFVGIELDGDYFQAAKDRLERHQLQLQFPW